MAAANKGKNDKVQIKRVYDEPSPGDGTRFLVDRLWPRGVKKSALSSVTWLRDVAPSAELRKWFGHDPDKWTEFRKRYRSELKKGANAYEPLLTAMKKGKITLLYSARDTKENQAVVLKDFLEESATR